MGLEEVMWSGARGPALWAFVIPAQAGIWQTSEKFRLSPE